MFISLLDGKLFTLKTLNMYYSLQKRCPFTPQKWIRKEKSPQYTSPKENSGQ